MIKYASRNKGEACGNDHYSHYWRGRGLFGHNIGKKTVKTKKKHAFGLHAVQNSCTCDSNP